MAHDRYISPFSTRYASDEMQYTFSDDNKFRTWRRLWIALAKAERSRVWTLPMNRLPSWKPTRMTSITRKPLPAKSWCATMS